MKVSKRLGHANAKITLETYAHLVPNEDNDLVDIFGKELENISRAFGEHCLKIGVSNRICPNRKSQRTLLYQRLRAC